MMMQETEMQACASSLGVSVPEQLRLLKDRQMIFVLSNVKRF